MCIHLHEVALYNIAFLKYFKYFTQSQHETFPNSPCSSAEVMHCYLYYIPKNVNNMWLMDTQCVKHVFSSHAFLVFFSSSTGVDVERLLRGWRVRTIKTESYHLSLRYLA